jgi:hypothetical protein
LFAAGVFLSALRMINYISVGIFIEYMLKSIGFKFEQDERNKFFSVCLLLFMLFDWVYFTKKSNSIIVTCEQFPKKKRVLGQIKFWIYVAFTIIFSLCVDKFFY